MISRCFFFIVVILSSSTSLFADEGMWLFNSPPLKQLKEKYQFEPTPQWLEHLQKSSLRFNSGGSGSFISPNGLAITNHHVGADTLQKISTIICATASTRKRRARKSNRRTSN
jgi:S1-C subfamily serine protease